MTLEPSIFVIFGGTGDLSAQTSSRALQAGGQRAAPAYAGPNLLLDEAFRETIHTRQQAWRDVVCLAQQSGIPVPGFASGLAYFDSYRAENLPQNLTQAQRDAFGSHTYQRRDDPDGPFLHTDWLK